MSQSAAIFRCVHPTPRLPFLGGSKNRCRLRSKTVRSFSTVGSSHGNSGSGETERLSWATWRSFQKDDGESLSTAEEAKTGEDEHVGFVHGRIHVSEAETRARELHELMRMRRSVRFFSSEEVPLGLVEDIIRTAGTSPSGAHLQPWTFVVVKDPQIKSKLRGIVEAAEQENYQTRMSEDWKEDIEPIVSNIHKAGIEKPYITDAPYTIVVMEHKYQIKDDGERQATYYSMESCSIATGILTVAIHNANLATVITTPLGAGDEIRDLLGRPKNERVLFLMPIGYPTEDCTVPYRSKANERKSLSEIMVL